MGTRRIFRRGGGAQNVKYPPCLASPGIAWAALVKGSSAYSTKAELIPLFSGALLGCPLSVYAGTAGSMAGAPGRWLCRGCRLGGALLLSFSGRSSFPSSLPSLCPLPSISWAALALLSGWLGDCIGWGRLGLPLSSCWPWLLCWLPWVQALAAVLSLSCVLSLSWVLALGSGAAVSLCPLSWVLAFLCCPLVLACYALGLGAGLGWGRCWAVQAVAVVAGWWLVCGDLAGLGIVILHKYSLADLVIFQAKSDKF